MLFRSAIHDAFATPEQRTAFRKALRAGLGWGDAKAQLVERIESQIGPMRARYAELMAHPERIEELLLAGAAKARRSAAPFLAQLRAAAGLRPFTAVGEASGAKAKKAAQPTWKQYRDSDGLFYFTLVASDGRSLLKSQGFAQGREAGQWVARLKREGLVADAPVQRLGSEAEIAEALASFAES